MYENGVTVGAMASLARRRNPAVREREAARRRERYREKMELARAMKKFVQRATERSSRVKSASAAECASSETWPSLSAGKSDSQAQCVVPLMFKSSQATVKTVLKSAEVQTPAARKITAGGWNRLGVVSVFTSDCGTSQTGASVSAGKRESQAQCVVPLMFKSSQATLRAKLRSVEVQTEDARRISAGDRQSGGHHLEVP